MKQWTLNMSKYHRGILDSKKGLQCMMLCIALLAPSYATASTNVGNEQKSFYEVTQPLSMMKETSNVSPIDNSVRGTIIDEKGVPLPGVSVAIKGTSTGVISDINGYYIINAKAGDILVFSFVGFKSQEITVGKRPALDIVMKEDVHELEETVIVGMGKQRKASVIGSISSVSIKELEVPQRNLTNALSGRIAGAVVVQRSGEPGQDNADFWVRGISSFGANQKPLVLVDGVERDMSDLSIEEVESISILKDASATAVYGVRAANGVVLVTTRKGVAQKPVIEVKLETGFSDLPTMPKLLDGVNYALLANEALGTENYTPEYIDNLRSGTNPFLYPNVNWMDQLFRKYSTNTNAAINIRGGGERARYYISASFIEDNGNLKNNPEADYKSNISLRRYNFRSNIDLTLTKTTNLSLEIGANMTDMHQPGLGNEYVDNRWFSPVELLYYYSYLSNPLSAPVRVPIGKDAFGNTEWGWGAPSQVGEVNPAERLFGSGYNKSFRSQIMSQITLKQDLSFLLKGLDIQASFSFDANNQTIQNRRKNSSTYNITGVDDETGEFQVAEITKGNEFLGYNVTPSSNRAEELKVQLNYNQIFNETHRIGAMAMYYQRDYVDQTAGSSIKSLPYKKQGLALRTTYAFKDRYFAEFNMGYNGSENFAKGHRFGFFPAYAVGWMISNEKFWEPILPVVSELKLKASYGSVGNDAIGGDRWIYQSTISTNNGWNYGENGSEGGGGIQVGNVENLNVSWEKAYKTNLGFEMRLFDRIKIQADYFHEKREGVFINRQGLPAIVGLTTKPKTNIGASVNRGVDATLEYEEKVGEVFLTGRANFTFNRNKLLNNDEVEHLYKYQNSIGKTFGTGGNHTFGLIAEGLFQSQEEIDNAPEQNFGTYRVGDVRYRDVNGDGVVDTYDKVALGYTNIPEITYGFGLTAQWRSWDINAFFQGIAHCTFYIGGTAMRPFSTGNINQSAINADIYDHVWKTTNTPEQNQAAYYPRLSEAGGEGSTNNNQTSTLTMRDGRFLRLKNFEIGYTIPKSILEKTFIKSTRIYVSGSNLLTFSKFKLWDPETGSSDGGIYPPLRVFTIGLNAKF